MPQYASIGPIAFHLPETVEDNDQLKALFPKWDMDLIYRKTGIRARHVAAAGQCASDLGVAAAEKLFRQYDVDRQSIDYLLFCTQSPDYPLPTTACLMQDRLGLRTSIGALDFNLGCSGFVYGLSLADGLIRSEQARRILLVTAETYSKYIHPTDRSLRTIFGDGAAATLIEAAAEPSLGSFVFGTDGRGGDTLMVSEGGARPAATALQPRKRKRWPSSLYMDGPELVKFSLDVVPPLVDRVLADARWTRDRVDLYLIHQATVFMLDHLRVRMELPNEQVPLALEEYGNTVSSTLPVLVRDLRCSGRLRPGTRTLLIGFGVGLSWAGCVWTETWQEPQVGEACGAGHSSARACDAGGAPASPAGRPPAGEAPPATADPPAGADEAA
jgi:3-oxoacyl-[acyl-carrier-protein] synthase-3